MVSCFKKGKKTSEQGSNGTTMNKRKITKEGKSVPLSEFHSHLGMSVDPRVLSGTCVQGDVPMERVVGDLVARHRTDPGPFDLVHKGKTFPVDRIGIHLSSGGSHYVGGTTVRDPWI